MTEKHSADQEIIDRYLADRLDQAERAMVETRIVHDTEFRDEAKLTDALRDGLRQLHAQGEVEPLIQTRPRMPGRAPLAIAAAVLACAIGVATFLIYRPSDDGRQALTTQTLHFVKTRGGDAQPDVTWKMSSEPTRVEMRLDVGVEPAAEYQISIVRLSGDAPAPVFEAQAPITSDGDVAIVVDSDLLEAGDYGIVLMPHQPDGLQRVTHYTLRVAD